MNPQQICFWDECISFSHNFLNAPLLVGMPQLRISAIGSTDIFRNQDNVRDWVIGWVK